MLYLRSGPRDEWPELINKVSKSWKSRDLPLNQDQWFTALDMIDMGLEFRSAFDELPTHWAALRECQLSPADWGSLAYASECLTAFKVTLRKIRPASSSWLSRNQRRPLILSECRRVTSALHTVVISKTPPHPSFENALQVCINELASRYSGESASYIHIWISGWYRWRNLQRCFSTHLLVLDPRVNLSDLLREASTSEELAHIVRACEALGQKLCNRYLRVSIMTACLGFQQLRRYYDLPREEPECGILDWWHSHATQFPQLAPFAMGILALPGMFDQVFGLIFCRGNVM
ncbi:hypothetical protein AAF712_010624 [Marasmius tenuissimus]|uniref:Uncharacterized protein n=1 Tax=Marasmius tenuissimus TaxID=585030 RepID=A0ABR2ZN72_9AGAR|nr:hypothetical protein PM082_000056 [Marasmius tenuissimus]